ncbi:hypothetical protein SARC_01051 [Sphaeroforma arctica JP610]|uniref:Uncharacterized protein n=1 Tax=Sphaeroforma arctica JP610 TaxID=667725 RepID=A0A0L0GD35_9EUKA|nr:hypothetical protein SARC_01051 [Sphaeroforma arctica JP610]KNC86819.1 hypothetical protein SARC_01051 [Sphaeroforma arctica JP610]|eukprot:XP_014160721.1 hypothetical protein SARC_01051 [Sphaeroforma arctica JP610]
MMTNKYNTADSDTERLVPDISKYEEDTYPDNIYSDTTTEQENPSSRKCGRTVINCNCVTSFVVGLLLILSCFALIFISMGMSHSKGTGIAAPKLGELAGEESIMSKKEHGTCSQPVQDHLRWKCHQSLADRICCFNRRYAENSGYWQHTAFATEVQKMAKEGDNTEVTFYDSVTGKPLFIAPRNRTMQDFISESRAHGWPSFRDDEVVKENVRVLSDGETVSLEGTHLGHNLPDRNGNRYCINLVSVAGNPSPP